MAHKQHDARPLTPPLTRVVQLKNTTWEIACYALRTRRMYGLNEDTLKAQVTKESTQDQADIVWDLRRQLGDVTDPATRKWRREHVPEVMQAHRA